MKTMRAPLAGPAWLRYVPVALLSIAAVALGSAYTAEFAYGLEPCALCLYQRIPFAAAGVLGGLAYLFDGRASLAVLTAIAGGALLAGAGVAFYHVGVEQYWWASAAACGGGAPDQTLSMNRFQALLQQKPEKACDEADWTLFGVSMAAYNAAASTVLGLGALWAAMKIRRAS